MSRVRAPSIAPFSLKDIFMSWLHALILGLVQGCTEFFPISSSAHLKMIKSWLQTPTGEETVIFDLACHLGTLIALVVYFRKDLWEICVLQPKKLLLYSVALLPLVPAYFLLKPVRLWASQPHLLGACLLITALLLFAAQKLSQNPSPQKLTPTPSQKPSWKSALWIGALQSVALVPGISRSASTIAGGVWQRLTVSEAVRFSFILSIPAVAGGAFLETLKLTNHTVLSFDASACAIGFGVSALVGLGVVRIAIPLLQKGVFRPFAWYCLIVAILLTVVS
jgi:undecaprenyl-diphosphatase